MAWITEDRCVQCADGCRMCGRKEYKAHVCDECGYYLNDKYFIYQNTEYCPDCACELFSQEVDPDEVKSLDEMAEMFGADICED